MDSLDTNINDLISSIANAAYNVRLFSNGSEYFIRFGNLSLKHFWGAYELWFTSHPNIKLTVIKIPSFLTTSSHYKNGYIFGSQLADAFSITDVNIIQSIFISLEDHHDIQIPSDWWQVIQT